MSPILLDTNAYTAFKRGHPEAVAIVQRAASMALNAIVLGELAGGFRSGTRERENRNELSEFVSTRRVVILPIDHVTAEHYADIYGSLRRTGTPIPTNDMWIAASALQHSLRVFTFDAHFGNVPGLRAGSTLQALLPP